MCGAERGVADHWPAVVKAEAKARDLVRPLVMSHRKLGHSSGGELQFAGWFDGATLAPLGSVELALCPLGGAVAVADVLGERVAGGVPVEVVGVLADELVARA